MALVFSQLKTYLYNWAVANVPLGMPVIYYYPNAPRPTVDYVSLLISSLIQVGWDYWPSPTDTAGDVIGIGDRDFTLQVQAYGGDPLTILENLRTSLQKQTVLDSLRVNGIVFVSWFQINDITDLVDSRYEQRATMDILFRVAQQSLDTNGTIAQLVTQEIILNVEGDVVVDQTLTIPPTI